MQGGLVRAIRVLGVAVVAVVASIGFGSKAAASPLVLNLGQSVGLAEIINHYGSVQVGNKIFSDFSIAGDVTANEVTVTAIQDISVMGCVSLADSSPRAIRLLTSCWDSPRLWLPT